VSERKERRAGGALSACGRAAAEADDPSIVADDGIELSRRVAIITLSLLAGGGGVTLVVRSFTKTLLLLQFYFFYFNALLASFFFKEESFAFDSTTGYAFQYSIYSLSPSLRLHVVRVRHKPSEAVV
jgi:hypothetical protein